MDRPGRRHTRRLLVIVWLVAFVVRVAYVYGISGAPFYGLRLGDAEAYHGWAARIAGGDWIGQTVFYQAPLYPYLLAGVYRLLGDSVTIVRVIQALVGASSCALLAWTGISLFGMAGAAAGFLLALYPPAIFLDGLLEKSALVTFLTAALLATLAIGASGRRNLFVLGAVLGLLALTRENALLLVLPIAVWLWVSNRRAASLIPFAAGLAIVLVPVGVANFAVGGEFQLTTAQSGPNFYIGNHAGARGTYEPLVTAHGSAADERQDATRLAEQASGRSLTPGEVSRFWTLRAFTFVRSHPIDWLALLARKLALTFNAFEITDTESQGVYAEWSSLLRALQPFDFGVVLALAVFGAVLTWGAWQRLWIFYAVGATYALSVVAFYVFARYRFPLVPMLMLFAAGGIAKGYQVLAGLKPCATDTTEPKLRGTAATESKRRGTAATKSKPRATGENVSRTVA